MPRLVACSLFAALLPAGAARAAGLDPLIPAKADTVSVYNVRQVVDSKLFQVHALPHLKPVLEQEKLAAVLKALDLDLLKDVDKMTTATWFNADEPDLKKQSGFVGIVHGRFKPETFFAAAQKAVRDNPDKVAIVKHAGYKLVEFTPNANDPDRKVYAALADEKTAVVAVEMKQAAETLKLAETPNARPAVKRPLAAMLLEQDEKASFYSVSLADPAALKAMKSANISPIPGVPADKFFQHGENMKSTTMALYATDDVRFEMAFTMADGGSADALARTAEELIGTAKAGLAVVALQQAKLKGVSDEFSKTAQAAAKGATTTVSVRLSADSIATLSGVAEGDE